MTNKEWLCTLSAEELCDVLYKVNAENCITFDKRQAMIDWLNEEKFLNTKKENETAYL